MPIACLIMAETAVARQSRGGQGDGSTTATAPNRGRAGRAGRGLRADTPTTIALQTLSVPRHEGFVEIAGRGDTDLVFLGDSITDWWRRAGQSVWDKTWAPLKAANFGIAGERVEQVLWRVQNGELDGYKPRLVVLMIGTNNLRGRITNQNIVDGIKVLVADIQKRQPDARLLLLGIFPRGAAADNPLRSRIKEINAELAKLNDGRKVFFMDLGDKLLTEDGTLTPEIMADGLHPTEKGYQIWADATLPVVKQLMGVQ
jgi:lysophospholipase L1-like esterase